MREINVFNLLHSMASEVLVLGLSFRLLKLRHQFVAVQVPCHEMVDAELCCLRSFLCPLKKGEAANQRLVCGVSESIVEPKIA